MRSLITSIAILALVGLVVGVAVQAADEASVGATVTVQNISVSVDDGAVAYGTLAVDTIEDTTSSGKNDSQTATNNGNVTVDLNIRGTNSGSWTLASAAGDGEYAHKFCTTDCDSSPTWTALTTSNLTLVSAVGTSGSQEFDLQITTPTITSIYTVQSVDVTIQATAS